MNKYNPEKYRPGDILLIDDHQGNLVQVIDEEPEKKDTVCSVNVIFGPRIERINVYGKKITYNMREHEIEAIMTDDEVEAFKVLHS